mmetsp:Transcript_32696/g.70495  ORF Transcript_32696/g.70495 Transcript_32696/m.70495 type:complete len:88 (-) Transcript_32696:487-750(-)
MVTLQRRLGLPLYDYSKVTYRDKGGRVRLRSVAADALDLANFHTSGQILPMLPETQHILDTLYCDSNRQLQQLMGGQKLPRGYACRD